MTSDLRLKTFDLLLVPSGCAFTAAFGIIVLNTVLVFLDIAVQLSYPEIKADGERTVIILVITALVKFG